MIPRMVINKLVLILLALAFGACSKPNEPITIAPVSQLESSAENSTTANSTAALANTSIESAYQHKRSDVQVSGGGQVVKLLADDTQGAHHQKFLVRVNPQQTLLFAHNTDLAAKIPLQVGDEITFSGEYVYNPKGGIIHWTHLDPHGHHPSGWIMLHGNKYQ